MRTTGANETLAMFETTFRNLDDTLRNYVQEGVDELDLSKLSATLTSKYGSVYEGQRQLGDVEKIKRVFIDFQYHLYNAKTA